MPTDGIDRLTALVMGALAIAVVALAVAIPVRAFLRKLFRTNCEAERQPEKISPDFRPDPRPKTDSVRLRKEKVSG